METIEDRFYVERVASGSAIKRRDIRSKKGDMLFAQFTDNSMRDSEADANLVCRMLNKEFIGMPSSAEGNKPPRLVAI